MVCVKVPTRLSIAVMLFSCIFIHVTMRYNISVNIFAMAPLTSNDTSINFVQDIEGLGWTSYERNLVLSSFHWGSLIASLLSGPVTERYGPRIVIFFVSVATCLLTMLSPFVSKISYLAMIALRVVLGVFSGFTFPSSQVLIAHWAVSEERSKFAAALLSGTVGTVVAWSLCGIIMDAFGWEWGFYIFGIAGFAWCGLWWYMVYDTPGEHPRITAVEKQYILDGTTNVTKHKLLPPYGRILTSVPVWATNMSFFGNAWGSYFILNAAPMFISSVLGFSASSTGFLSSIINLVEFVMIYMFAFLGDFLLTKNLLSKNALRKSFLVFSHMMPACFMVVLTYSSDPITALVLMVIAMSFTGASTVTIMPVFHDMAPNFAGSLYGQASAFSKISGVITPIVVAYFTKDDETSFDAWRPVFYIAALMYIATSLIFILFGSMELQPWNEVKENQDLEKPKEIGIDETDVCNDRNKNQVLIMKT